ncbi:MAG: nucleotidyltransferase domain-containing protein [Planctomycetota bacterium]
MLRWPDRGEVERALRAWAGAQIDAHPELLRLGYFGSYARGDAGVGSDLDLVAVIRETDVPFERRGVTWTLESLPVPAEILIYTISEWELLLLRGGRFASVLEKETIWLTEKA